MKIFSYIDDAASNIQSCVIALGNFDGIHYGHQKLIKTAVQKAKELNIPSAVFTFSNHPVNVLSGTNKVKNIMDINEKAEVIENLGVDYMINVCFNNFIMRADPKTFVEKILVRDLKIQHAVCGFNYTFGYKAEGNAKMLADFGKEYGFGVSVIDEVKVKDTIVSSTLIRSLISEGKVSDYQEFVGRKYRLEGVVIKGEMLGRKLGFPTINLSLSDKYALPANGVYITKTYIKGKVYRSVTNVGNKPTVGEFRKNAETHIFDFNEDIYGETVKIEFFDMLRPEKKFDTIEELSRQITQDCIDAKNYKW